MGGKTWGFVKIVFILNLITKIYSSQVQPSLTEYLIAALGSNAPVSPTSPPYYQHYGPNYQTPLPYTTQPKPSSTHPGQRPGSIPKPLTAVANLAAAIPVTETAIKTPSVPKSSEISSTPLDSNVLNNLAIALQLLIVSNILNTPPESLAKSKSEIPKLESVTRFETVPITPLSSLSGPSQSLAPVELSALRSLLSSMSLQSSQPTSIDPSALRSLLSSLPSQSSPLDSAGLRNLLSSYDTLSLPNSKFLGSSGIAEPSVYSLSSYGSAVTPYGSPLSSLGSSLASFGSPVQSLRPNTRSSMTLMSPYEALASGSPYSDSILSSVFSSGVSKRDFQSPYAAILAADGNRDLFSL